MTVRKRWQAYAESEKIAIQVVALAVLGFLYFAWPTPYLQEYRVLPQGQSDYDLAPAARYRVQVNRFTGTVWAETVEGWRRFESKPLPESELAFEQGSSEWYDSDYRPPP